jgi:hypothetical protein
VFEVVLILATYFLWSTIHEAAHVATAHILVGVRKWTIIPVPHLKDGRWFWARAEYWPKDVPDERQRGLIAMAPRLPDFAAMLIMPFVPWPWTVLAAGAWVDMAVGAIGVGENSDLQRAVRGLKIGAWSLRLFYLLALAGTGWATCALI